MISGLEILLIQEIRKNLKTYGKMIPNIPFFFFGDPENRENLLKDGS